MNRRSRKYFKKKLRDRIMKYPLMPDECFKLLPPEEYLKEIGEWEYISKHGW